MSDWLPSPQKNRDSRPPQIGQPPYEWQPSRTVEASYSLLARDEAEYGEFKCRADQPAAWREASDYIPNAGEPLAEELNRSTDFWWWVRVGDELWILTEGMWAYFPDPLPYGLNVKAPSDTKFRYLGHFGLVPDHWQNIPKRRA